MSIWVSFFFADLINNFACSRLCGNFLKQKNKKQNNWLYLVYIIVLSLLSVFMMINFPSTIRMIGKFSTMIIIFYLLYRCQLSTTIITTFIIYLVFAISEILSALFLFSVVGADSEFLTNTELGIIITNLGILLCALSIFKSRKLNKFFENIISWYEEKNTLNLILVTIYSIVCIYILMTYVSSGVPNSPLFYVCSIFSVSIILFIGISFKANADRSKVIKEYDTLMNYVGDYEHIMDNQRKIHHEYKNQLIIINDLIPKNNVKARRYISELLEDNGNDKSYAYLSSLSSIHLNGVKGLLYYKLNQMIRNGIEVYVSVDIQNYENDIWNVCDKNLKDLSRILGVYLDNAKEAACQAQKKYVIIDIVQTDRQLLFSISNTYDGIIDLSKIDEEKYSTKGRNRGYGLSLVRDIIGHNPLLKQEREFNGIYFVQKLFLDLNKQKEGEK